MRKPPLWLESAVDNIDVALLVVAADYTVSYANFAAHKMFGMAHGRLEGTPMEQLIVPERRAELRNLGDVLGGGGARRVRSVLKREDGTRIDVAMTLEPCLDAAGAVGAVSVRYEVMPAGRTTLTPSVRSSLPPQQRVRFVNSSSPEARRSPPPLGMAQASMPPAGAAASSWPPRREPPPLPTATTPTMPAPRPSEPRLSRTRTATELEHRLARLQRHLQWLEERLSVPSSIQPLDDPRERARAMLVVSESRGLVQESLEELESELRELPAPPKMPKL